MCYDINTHCIHTERLIINLKMADVDIAWTTTESGFKMPTVALGTLMENIKALIKKPTVALGTLMENIEPDNAQVAQLVRDAIDLGYRHFDTAQIYRSEPGVGKGIRDKIESGDVKREDIFVTTKLWRNAHGTDDVVPSLRSSLQELGLDYVDLFLIHWPTAFQSGPNQFPKDEVGKFQYASIDYLDTWKGMESCVDLGLTKYIGLSNYNSKQIQRILDTCRIKPVNLQIEVHPYLSNSKLVAFCKSHDITVMAYSPLGGFKWRNGETEGPSIFNDSTIQAIARKYEKSPAQIALRFQLQRGVAVCPKSSKKHRIAENINVFDFTLGPEDMNRLLACDRNYRLNAEFPDHPFYPFHENF
ncbi:unnamed protein product [Owenia fusiformis]|uniref:NADP-dependent oxidoreductase domain-containing protein n=1 Tax=Owenia fusiformis TaxID=6347 RepID=A0A8S4NRU0_OWEFU|nr:unnamed protein product [Owenia fusiformis]